MSIRKSNPAIAFALLVGVLVVSACAPFKAAIGTLTGQPGSLATLASSSVGTSLINALSNNLAPGVNAAIAKGVTAAAPELKIVAYSLPWAKQALDFFGPKVLDPTKMAALDAGIAAAEATVAHPPTDVASAVRQGAAIFQQVTDALKPAVAAAPGAVAPPPA